MTEAKEAFSMGGLIVVVLWPMLIPLAILYVLDVALPLIAPILLVWNGIVLAALLLARGVWKRSGTMDRSFIGQCSGWRRILLTLARYGLTLLILWEILLVVLCAAYLIWRFPIF